MASLAAIFRQVKREGARWGLYPIMRAAEGKVAVAEMVNELPQRPHGCMVIPEKAPRVVASLDEDSGMDAFSAILRHRLTRFQHDFVAMIMKRQRREKEEAEAELRSRREQFRAFLRRSNNRVISVGGIRR